MECCVWVAWVAGRGTGGGDLLWLLDSMSSGLSCGAVSREQAKQGKNNHKDKMLLESQRERDEWGRTTTGHCCGNATGWPSWLNRRGNRLIHGLHVGCDKLHCSSVQYYIGKLTINRLLWEGCWTGSYPKLDWPIFTQCYTGEFYVSRVGWGHGSAPVANTAPLCPVCLHWPLLSSRAWSLPLTTQNARV